MNLVKVGYTFGYKSVRQKHKEVVPGPGSYDVMGSFKLSKTEKKMVGFTKGNRFQKKDNGITTPGPSFYTPKYHAVHLLSNPATFSKSPKGNCFETKSTQCNIGPGLTLIHI